MDNVDMTNTWGVFAPTGAARLLLLLKRWGLARGAAKKHLGIAANGLEGRVRPLQVALGAETATMTMIVTVRDMGGSRIAHDGDDAGSAISVQVAPLGEVLREARIDRVDALKIDVEGMEDAVLFPFFEAADRAMWPRMVIIEHTSRQQWKRDILPGWSTRVTGRSGETVRMRCFN